MSDETALQIKHLIEITKQDFELKAALLEDNVQGDFLVADILEDIRIDVGIIKDGLFQFFKDEQDRFQIQQNLDDEQYFRELEALRESRRRGFVPIDNTKEGLTLGEQVANAARERSDGDSGGVGILGALGAGGVGILGALGAIAGIRLLLGSLLRFVPFVRALAVGAFAIDMLSETFKNLKALEAAGLDSTTATKEAISQAFAETMADAYDVTVAPALTAAMKALGDELGYTTQEVNEMEKSIREFRSSFKDAMLFVADEALSYFGDETAISSRRIAEREIEELKQDVVDAEARQERLQELEEKKQASIESGGFGLSVSEDAESVALSMQQTPEEAQAQLTEAQRRLPISQAGFRAGDLETYNGLNFKEGLSSEQKERYFEENVAPNLQSALDSGAIERSLGTGDLLEALPGVNLNAAPIEIKSLDKLMDLNEQQLEAILINDDILNRSTLQTGALDSGDRKIVEYVYRIKTEGAADPLRSPSISNGPIKLDSQADDFLPTAVPSTTQEPSINMGSVPATPLGDLELPETLQPTIDNAMDVGLEALKESGLIEALNQFVIPSPSLSAVVPVGDMSRNVAATSSAPIVISSTQGGSTVNNMVNNSSTNVFGGGVSARSADVAHRRYYDKMQGAV